MKKRIAKKKGKGIFSSFSPFRNTVAVLYGPPPITECFSGKRKKSRTDNEEGKEKENKE